MQIIDRVATRSLATGDRILVERHAQSGRASFVCRTKRTRDRVEIATVYDFVSGKRGRHTIYTNLGVVHAHSANHWNRVAVAEQIPCLYCGRLTVRRWPDDSMSWCEDDARDACRNDLPYVATSYMRADAITEALALGLAVRVA